MNQADERPSSLHPIDRLIEHAPGNEFRLKRRVTTAVGVGALITALLGLLSWQMSRLAAEDSEQVVRTYQVSRQLQLTLRHFDNIETGVRGFALTGVEQFLEPYERGKKGFPRDLNALPGLLTNSPDQQRRFATFKALTAGRLQAAADLIAQRRKTGRIPDMATLLAGKQVMDAVGKVARQMDLEERRLLDERTHRFKRRRHLTSMAIGFGSLLGVIFLTVAGVVIHRGIGVAARAQGQVEALNADLEGRVRERTAAFEAEAVARRETEGMLRSSEQMFRTLLDGISDHAIYMVDIDGKVASWNAGAARITGYTAEEIIGRHVSTFHPAISDFQQHAQQSLEKAALTGRSEEEAFRVRKDGSTFWASAVFTALHDATGSLIGYTKVMRDISVRKRSEEELRKQAKLLDLAHDAIIVRDAREGIVFWNEGAARLYGWSTEEVAGRSVHSLLQTVFPVSLESVQESLVKKGQWEGELQHTTRSGAVIVVTSRMSMQRDEQGAPVATMEINRDITDRKQAEEIRERMAAVINYSNDAIMSKTLDGTVTDWNYGAEKLFGYTAAEIVGKPIEEVMTRELAAEELRMIGRISLGESLQNFETVWTRKDGATIYVSVAFSPIRDSQGRIVGASKVARDITDRKQAEERLREKEHLLSQSQRIAHIGSWTCDLADPEGKLVWSDELYRMYGTSKASFAPTIETLIARIFPDDQAAMRAWIEECVAGKNPADLEFRLQMPDGAIRYFSRRGELQCDAQNKPIRITGTTQDITERKLAGNLLRESEERFQTMVNGIPQLAWMANSDGWIHWYNQRWYAYTGTTFADMQGWGWQSVHHPDTLAAVLEEWRDSIQKGLPFEMEFPLRGADGVYRTFLTGGMPLKDANGRVLRWFGTNTDISERKQNEERLALQAEELSRSRQDLETQKLLLQSILDSLQEGLVAIDEQGKFLLWNPAAKKIIGMDPVDLSPEEWSVHYGSYLPDMVTPFPSAQHPLVRAVAGEVSSAVMYLRRGSDQVAWLEINGAPLRDTNGKSRGGVVAFRDITQRKADELEIRNLNEDLEERIAVRTAQLETANKELQAFTYSVSHDLRAPLRHIGGFARLLIGDFGDSMAAEAKGHLQRIQDAVTRMGMLVDALLSLAKLGRQSLKMQPNEMNAIVDQVIAMLQPECEGREVEWRVAGLPAMECDRILIGQVFQNLLGNALKYSRGRAKAVIEVDSIEEEGKPTVIYVRDNGAGFDMRYASKLFEVFQRMHTESEFEGSGVGLATVHRIVQKHGGTVWAKAEMDRGATFFFTLGTSDAARLAPRAVAAGV